MLKEQKNLLVFSNDSIYREVDIDEFEKDEVLCGNTSECDIRLRIKSAEEIIIVFRKINDTWQIIQNEGVYYIANGIKTPRKQLVHGDTIVVKHNIHKGELLNISYFIDFKSSLENYDLKIELNKSSDNTIGTDNSKNIIIKNELLGNSAFSIRFEDNKWNIYDNKTKYGVYVNGNKVDNKKTIKDNDFIVLTGYKFFFKNGFLYTSKYDEDLSIRGINSSCEDKTDSVLKYPAFLRSPRMMLKYPSKTVDILKPPNKPSKPNTSLITSMIPLVGMIALTLAFRIGGDPKYVLYSIGSVALTAFVTILTIINQNKNYKKEILNREIQYTQYISQKDKELNELLNLQRNNMLATYTDINENYNMVINEDRRLWERNPKHEDFLLTRLGTGSCEPSFKINIPKRDFKQDDDPISEKPYELHDKYKVIENIPILIPIEEAGSIGVIGKKENLINFANNITIDITSHHYSEDVKLVYLFDEEYQESYDWIRLLPHVWSKDNKNRFIANCKENSTDMLKSIYRLLEERVLQSKDKEDNTKNLPHYVIFVLNRSILENEPVSKYIGKEKDLGITFIFLYEYMEFIPKECSYIVTLEDNNIGTLQLTELSEVKHKFSYEVLDSYKYKKYAEKLAPIYINDGFSENTLTKSISLFELYNINKVNDIDLYDNWSKDKIYKTMGVPLGVRIGDDVVNLDIHEKHHGPHGLVAGTTGSGKSEILQSYVASMSINFHPHDVAFIIIDFKGGGMANQFKDLPHLVGTITNIDGNQINRTLKSIESELKKRQKLFTEQGVNHIDAYMQAYKSNKTNIPLPHLIIIVDEFAELKSEQPEFMAKLISTARIGRSLGVHLILATQKPAGVVDDQIWSNSKFKLCLKVQTKEDSRDVIKDDVAAEIVEPGRAYLQVGNNEIFELFQSAWSGAKVYEDDDMNKRDFDINMLDIIGNRQLLFSTKESKQHDEVKTELDTIVEYINSYCECNSIKKLPELWLPPLESHITLKDLMCDTFEYDNKWMAPIIGKYDNPEEQEQGLLHIDMAKEGHLLAVGSPGSGKTTMLQTIIMSSCLQYSSEDLNIYIMDFGGRTLRILEDLPQVGGVVTSDEEEKVHNLINMIMNEILVRKEKFSKFGVNSLVSYKNASGEQIPHIMIAIDNFGALLEYFDDIEDSFNTISREGANLGITIVMTANQTSSVRYKIMSNIGIKIALNCNDKGEYSTLIDRCRMEPENVPGRGLIELDKRIFEFQTALAIEGNDEVERANNIKILVKDLYNKNTFKCARPIPVLPETISLSEAVEELILDEINKYIINIGMSHEAIEYEYMSLIDNPIIPILGTTKSGKTNMIKSICNTLEAKYKDSTHMYVVDLEDNLEDISELSCNRMNISDIYEIDAMLDDILNQLKQREHLVRESKLYGLSKEEALKEEPLIVVVIDNGDALMNRAYSDYELQQVIKELFENYINYKACVIIGGTDSEFNNDYNEVVKITKSRETALIFDKITNQGFYSINEYIPNEKSMKVGDAYLFKNGKYIKLRTPINDFEMVREI